MITTKIIANTFLLRGAKENIPLTLMKVQKLAYILYKEYYKETKQKLFTEKFEKWRYGPALPSLYYEFKFFKDKSITRFARNANGVVEIMNLKSNLRISKIFEEVWNKYKNFSAIELSSMTTCKNTAWDKTDKNFLRDEDIINEETYI